MPSRASTGRCMALCMSTKSELTMRNPRRTVADSDEVVAIAYDKRTGELRPIPARSLKDEKTRRSGRTIFTPRFSHFDRNNVASAQDPFRGLYTLFWIRELKGKLALDPVRKTHTRDHSSIRRGLPNNLRALDRAGRAVPVAIRRAHQRRCVGSRAQRRGPRRHDCSMCSVRQGECLFMQHIWEKCSKRNVSTGYCSRLGPLLLDWPDFPAHRPNSVPVYCHPLDFPSVSVSTPLLRSVAAVVLMISPPFSQ
jgi:hypothetical protein